jgi:hypothetical protein
MRMVMAAVLAAALFGGCASAGGKTVYDKPGASGDQQRADEAACTRAAIDNAGQRGAAYLAVDRDVVTRCMQARGYIEKAPKLAR